jgi:hypothetical protein
MSNIFTRNLLKDLLNEETSENNYSLPQFINIIDKKNNNNFTSSYMPQVGGNDFNHGTSNSTEDDVNQLISMLTSESDDSMKFSANSTQTEVLENRLKNMTFNGGGLKKMKQKGGSDPQKIKEACKLLEEAGYTFSIKNQNCEQYLEKNSPSGIMKDFNLNNIFTKPAASPKNNKESNPSTSSFKPGTIYDTETSTVKKDLNSSATSSINQANPIKDLSDTSDVKPATKNSSFLPPVPTSKMNTTNQSETKSANSTSSFLPAISASKMTATSQSETKTANSTSSFLPVGSVSKMSSTSLSSVTSIPNASETENRTLLDSAVDMVKGVTKSISRVFVGDSDTSQSNASATSSQKNIVNPVLPSPTSSEKPTPTSSEKPTQTGGAKRGRKKMSKKASKKSSNKKKNSTKKGKKMSGGAKKKGSKKASSKKGKKMSGGAKKRGTKKASSKKSKKSSKKSKKNNKTRKTK